MNIYMEDPTPEVSTEPVIPEVGEDPETTETV